MDIEYAINLDGDGAFVVNLLQCRPLYLGGENEAVDLDNACVSRTLFEVIGASMGPSRHRAVDVDVLVTVPQTEVCTSDLENGIITA